MEIKGRAQSAPAIHGQHDRQILPVEPRPDCCDAEQLKADKRDEEKDVELFVFKHGEKTAKPSEGALEGSRAEGPLKWSRRARAARAYLPPSAHVNIRDPRDRKSTR